MKKLFCIVGLFALTVFSFAQSFAWEYNTKGKNWSPIVIPAPALKLTEVPLVKSLDFAPIVGIEGGSGRPMVGFLVSKSGRLARELDWTVGATFRVAQQRPPTLGGIVIGVTLRLRS